MGAPHHMARFGLAALAAASLVARASAAQLAVTPELGDLQAVLDQAADGDEVRLSAGTYRGPLRIAHRISRSRRRGISPGQRRDGHRPRRRGARH
ncbi:hypothetical protein AAFX91_10130 [Bradyrhizobium sp. 31Argb]|uniref:hypothetical protein n=1 Tax=Bradyrhizobium sp. 31Argb TaxID=3141247 RepID=UPI003749CAE5